MIRTNLSTRPFYNERAVTLVLLSVAVLLAAATGFNAIRILQYSHSDTTLALAAQQNEARAADLRAAAAKLRSSVDPQEIEAASNEARLANGLIDRRTFSWTELFNWFETTLPANARITAVRPKIDRDGRIAITVNVVARGVDDVNAFLDRLDETGAFKQLQPADERVNEQQLFEATIDAVYVPSAARAPKAPAAVPQGTR